MKYFSLILVFLFLSCGNKEAVLLPKSDVTIVNNVVDHSPIYIFFRTNEKDTLAEVNKKNEIISTNWIFNIDKRLPLRLVIPEVMKLQEKKRSEVAHKNEKAENYYSYADSIGKNLAFLPFTKVFYKLEMPKSGVVVFFSKKNKIFVNNVAVKREVLQEYIINLVVEKPINLVIYFDKNCTYGSYVQNKIFMRSLVLTNKGISFDEDQEFVY